MKRNAVYLAVAVCALGVASRNATAQGYTINGTVRSDSGFGADILLLKEDGKIYVNDNVTTAKTQGFFSFGKTTAIKSSADKNATRPISPVAADFDGDGKIDFAVGHRFGKSVSLFQNKGPGKYPFVASYEVNDHLNSTSTVPSQLCAADLDNDGDIDISVLAEETTLGQAGTKYYLYQLLNKGKFKFDLAFLSTYYAAKKGSLFSVTPELHCADIDGNGVVDNVVLDDTGLSAYMREMKGPGTSGWMGTYGAMMMGTKRVNGVASSSVLRSQMSDVDGDGDLDLVAVADDTATGKHGVTVQYNTLGGDLFQHAFFEQKPSSAQGLVPAAHCLKLADLDNDGDVDAVLCSDSLQILLNDGKGHFAYAKEVAAYPPPSDVVAADIDHDGDIDLSVVASSVDAANQIAVKNAHFAVVLNDGLDAKGYPKFQYLKIWTMQGLNTLLATDLTPYAGGLKGVTVSAGNYKAITDASGRFVITNVPPGKYFLLASKPGYNFYLPGPQSVNVTDVNIWNKNFTVSSIYLGTVTDPWNFFAP